MKFTTLGIFELVVIWFTFGWREYGENDYTAEELENKKKRTDYLKFTGLIFGAMLAFFALKGFPMLIISLAFAACCVVASISHKSMKPIVVSWVSLVLSLAAICFFKSIGEAAWTDNAKNAVAFVSILLTEYAVAEMPVAWKYKYL